MPVAGAGPVRVGGRRREGGGGGGDQRARETERARATERESDIERERVGEAAPWECRDVDVSRSLRQGEFFTGLVTASGPTRAFSA